MIVLFEICAEQSSDRDNRDEQRKWSFDGRTDDETGHEIRNAGSYERGNSSASLEQRGETDRSRISIIEYYAAGGTVTRVGEP